MASPVRSFAVFSAALLFLGLLLATSATRAHPPHAPFLNPFGEDSKFAPITRFGPQISIELVADGMTAPLKGVAAPGLSRWLFVVDQPGVVWAVDLSNPDTATNKTVFLDVRALIVTLGVAARAHSTSAGSSASLSTPSTSVTGSFYTYTSEPRDSGVADLPTPGTTAANADHHNVVSEWRPTTPAIPQRWHRSWCRRELMRIDWPQFNHDGGDLAFGPDGKLYISMGDGGGADDADGQPFVTAPAAQDARAARNRFRPQGDGNAQKLNTPLGKILRIDVNPPHSGQRQYGIPARQPVRRHGRRRQGDLGLRLPQPVPLVVRHAGPASSTSATSARTTSRRWTSSSGRQLRLEPQGRHAVLRHQRQRARRRFRHQPESRSAAATAARPDADRPDRAVRHPPRGPLGDRRVRLPRRAMSRRCAGSTCSAEFSLLFKFPIGPHDYGRLFTMSASGSDHGLRRISELLVVPGGAISLAVLGMGQDAKGEIYVTGNISGLPFPDAGPDETLNTPDDIFRGRIVRIIRAEDSRGGHGHHHND